MNLPKAEKKEAVTVQIESELLTRVRFHIKQRGISLRSAIEFGLEAFVKECEREQQLEFEFNGTQKNQTK